MIPTIINNVCPGRRGMFLNANLNIMRFRNPITKTMDIAIANPIKSVLAMVSVDNPNISVINITHYLQIYKCDAEDPSPSSTISPSLILTILLVRSPTS